MNEKIMRSPQGYAYLDGTVEFPKSGNIYFHGERSPSPDFTPIWTAYQQAIKAEPSIGLAIKAVSAANIMFGADFMKWLVVQVTANPDIGNYKVDFLVDTIRYINGESREYGLATWLTLMNVPVSEEESKTSKEAKFENLDIPDKTKDLLGMWVARDGGLDDMIHTLNILFGK